MLNVLSIISLLQFIDLICRTTIKMNDSYGHDPLEILSSTEHKLFIHGKLVAVIASARQMVIQSFQIARCQWRQPALSSILTTSQFKNSDYS
jgi:hypothetical protein